MPLDPVSDVLLSLLGLLQGSVLTTAPVFAVTLAAAALRKKLAARFGLSWIKSSFIVTYLTVLVISALLYFSPLVASLGEGIYVPAPFQNELWVSALSALAVPLRLVLVCLAFAVLLLPLELIGSLVFDASKQRWPKINYYLNVLISVFVTVVIAALLAIWLLPAVFGIDVITGVLYMLFYGTG